MGDVHYIVPDVIRYNKFVIIQTNSTVELFILKKNVNRIQATGNLKDSWGGFEKC